MEGILGQLLVSSRNDSLHGTGDSVTVYSNA